ncbi:L,D-transpeptidase family protein [Marinicella sp. W31]|uniref:L,D-transpeptidase family protein n=1 Tax=Marinicella sp. W31 TaxID=3023713 RepID=UPI003756EED9
MLRKSISHNRLRGAIVFLSLLLAFSAAAEWPESQRSKKAVQQWSPILHSSLQSKKMQLGAPLFIRIFKQEAELEVWMQAAGGQFELYKKFPICTFSGALGPKQKEGDWQSPEGFYFVNAGRLNPWSRFHLSFNLGYPNAYDRFYARTGSALMVHGDCVSIGCYAMTDQGIEEIYTLVQKALQQGQAFIRVHAFPFRMTDSNMQQHKKSKWQPFWQNLKQGYDWFEKRKQPPNVEHVNGSYVFDAGL